MSNEKKVRELDQGIVVVVLSTFFWKERNCYSLSSRRILSLFVLSLREPILSCENALISTSFTVLRWEINNLQGHKLYSPLDLVGA